MDHWSFFSFTKIEINRVIFFCCFCRCCSYEGRHTIHKKVPDTITSWIITGFSLDPISGIGLTKEPRSLEVFQPFFVSLNLPYSVKRGEVISIPVGVFNYLDEDFDVEVTLHNTDQELEFVQMANEVDAPSEYRLHFLNR